MKLTGGIEDIVARSNSLVDELVAPPGVGQGICLRCRTWNDSLPATECSNCQDVRTKLETSPVPLDVISLYQKPSNLRDWLTRYKGRLEDLDEPYVAEYEPIVEALIGRYIHDYGARIDARSGGIDCIVVVPSTKRPSPHPLEALLRKMPLDVPVRTLLRRGPGLLDFRRPAVDAYVVNDSGEDCGPQQIYLVDDVYTTGARINSAALALAAAGHHVVGAFVVARRVNTGYHEQAREMWDRQAARRFDWTSSPIVGEWS